MTLLGWLLYGLGAIQATALTVLLLRVHALAQQIRHRVGLLILGALLWPLWALLGLLLFVGWVASYPWRIRLRAEGKGRP